MRRRLSLALTDVAVTRRKYEFGLDLPLSPPTSVCSHHAILIGLENRFFFPFHAIETKILSHHFFSGLFICPLQSALFWLEPMIIWEGSLSCKRSEGSDQTTNKGGSQKGKAEDNLGLACLKHATELREKNLPGHIQGRSRVQQPLDTITSYHKPA